MKKTEIKKVTTKQLMARLDKLCDGAGVNAYEKCLIIKEIFENKKHLKFFKNADDRSKKLQEYCGTMALTVAACLQMIKFFPKKKDWENGRLDVLQAESAKLLMKELNKNKKKKKNEPDTKSRRDWRADYFKLLDENRELVLKLAEVKSELKGIKETLAAQ